MMNWPLRFAYLISIQPPVIYWTELDVRMWDEFMLEYVPDWRGRVPVRSLSNYDKESINDEGSEDKLGDEYGDAYDESGEHDNEDDHEQRPSNKANNEHINSDT
jgi:hypothetical protein